MQEDLARKILTQNIKNYDKIASKFSDTRKYLSPDLRFFLKWYKNDKKILDLGCGNGRLAKLFPKNNYTGVDPSKQLINISQKLNPGYKFLVSKPNKLNFSNGSFDIIYCLAVFHHIPSKKIRIEFLKEIKRLLIQNGICVFTVWNIKYHPKISKLILKNNIKKLFGLSKLDFNDVYFPFKNQKNEFYIQRYLHAFSLKELKDYFTNCEFEIIDYGISNRGKHQNLYIVARSK